MMQSKFDIDDLLPRFFRGETTPEENCWLLAWKSESEEHRRLFEEMNELWILSVAAASEPSPDPADELARLKATIAREERGEVSAVRTAARSGKRPKNGWLLLLRGAAAAVLILLGMGGGALLYHRMIPQSGMELLAEEMVVPDTMRFAASRGSLASVTLPDGTVVRLNAGSSLVYTTDYGRSDRPVALSGEAFFQVKSDPDRPFVVRAGSLSIVATGTAFNVKAYPEEPFVTTTLESGVVNVRGISRQSDAFDIELKPCQIFMYYDESDPLLVDEALDPEEIRIAEQVRKRDIPALLISNVNTQTYTSWKDPRWIVEYETLASLAEKLGRRYNVTIRFQNQEAGAYCFSGSFENETIEEIMQLLRHATPIRYAINRGQITISVDPARRRAFEHAASAGF